MKACMKQHIIQNLQDNKVQNKKNMFKIKL